MLPYRGGSAKTPVELGFFDFRRLGPVPHKPDQ